MPEVAPATPRPTALAPGERRPSRATPAATTGMAARPAATGRKWATGPRPPAISIPAATTRNSAKLPRAPLTSTTHPASGRSAPRRRSRPKTQVAPHATPPGSVRAKALAARAIAVIGPRPTSTLPARSSRCWIRAKTTMDAASRPSAASSSPQRTWTRE